MNRAMNHVIGIIREEEGGFRLSFPDFPGLGANGETLAAAVSRAAEVVAAEIGSRADASPAPVNLEPLDTGQPDWMGRGIAVLVPVPLRPAEQPEQAGPEAVEGEAQVPLSGRVLPAEEPTERAKASVRGEEGSLG